MIMKNVDRVVIMNSSVNAIAIGQIRRPGNGESVNPIDESYVGGVYLNMKRRYGSANAGRYVNELSKLVALGLNPTDISSTMKVINTSINKWRLQEFDKYHKVVDVLFAVLALQGIKDGDDKKGAVKEVAEWFDKLEQAEKEGIDIVQFNSKESVLDVLRDYEQRLKNEGGLRVSQGSDKKKSGAPSVTAKDMTQEEKRKTLKSMYGKNDAAINAFLAAGESKDKGGNGSEKGDKPVAPFTVDGMTFHPVPGTSVVYAHPKQKGIIPRAVTAEEGIHVCAPPGENKQIPFPYVATTEPDTANGRYGVQQCHKCKLYQHPRRYCLYREFIPPGQK